MVSSDRYLFFDGAIYRMFCELKQLHSALNVVLYSWGGCNNVISAVSTWVSGIEKHATICIKKLTYKRKVPGAVSSMYKTHTAFKSKGLFCDLRILHLYALLVLITWYPHPKRKNQPRSGAYHQSVWKYWVVTDCQGLILQLFKRLCPSVGPTVDQSVRPWVTRFLKTAYSKKFMGILLNSTKFNSIHNISQLIAIRPC